MSANGESLLASSRNAASRDLGSLSESLRSATSMERLLSAKIITESGSIDSCGTSSSGPKNSATRNMIVNVRNEHKTRRFEVDMATFRYEPHATSSANTHTNNQADVGMERSQAKRTAVASTGSDCRPNIQRTRVLLITTPLRSLLVDYLVGD